MYMYIVYMYVHLSPCEQPTVQAEITIFATAVIAWTEAKQASTVNHNAAKPACTCTMYMFMYMMKNP